MSGSTGQSLLLPQSEGDHTEVALISKTGRRKLLVSKVVTIGRRLTNSLVIRNPWVSSHHAEIRLEEQGHLLIDLESCNGTFLNGHRIVPQVGYQLVAGDEISFGFPGDMIFDGFRLQSSEETARRKKLTANKTLFRYEVSVRRDAVPAPELPPGLEVIKLDEDLDQLWREGTVNQTYEHMKVYYRHDTFMKSGKAFSDCYTLVALVAPGTGNQFIVQFCFDPRQGDPETNKILTSLRQEFDLFFRGVTFRGTWGYLFYHSSAISNIYREIFWSAYLGRE